MIWKVCVIWKWSTRYGMILCHTWSLFSSLISYCYWLLDIEKYCFQWEKLWNRLCRDFNKTGKFSLCLEEKKRCCRDSRFPSNILLATLPIIKLPNERWWSKVQQWFLFYQSAHLGITQRRGRFFGSTFQWTLDYTLVYFVLVFG